MRNGVVECLMHNLLWLFTGDEILFVNGFPMQGLSHAEAIGMFKKIKTGDVVLKVSRRAVTKQSM